VNSKFERRSDPDSSGAETSPLVQRFTGLSGFVIILFLILLAWNAGRTGVASVFTAIAGATSEIASANEAVAFGAGNPDAHYVRGTILEGLQDLPDAVEEFNQAAAARPDDFALWLRLARARELNGEIDGAIAAARQAIPLAPYYAEPHWQLGNILLRAGQRDEAFKELGLAGVSNPTLMPGVIGLAWQVSNGDVQFVEQAIQPGTPEAYQALGHFFRLHHQADAAIAMYIAAGNIAEEERRSYVGELIAAKQFNEAVTLWAIDHQTRPGAGVIIDPGFEQETNLNEPGFAWRLGQETQGFHLSLDPTNTRQGRASLKVDFDGDSDPSSPVISQLVLVEPRAHYRLSFAARSEGIVSGGLPRVVVFEADSNNVLGQSDLPRTTDGWRDFTIDFDSGPSTGAIQISVGRQNCGRSPCPIFGRLWLDNFLLQKL